MDAAKQIHSLSFEDLSFSFGPSHKALFVGLNFDFKKGESYWIRGAPGSGKSTLLRILVALSLPMAGEMKINGECINKMSFEEFLPFRKQIGYSFDLGGLISNRTLFDNLMLPLVYHHFMPEPEARQWVESLGEQFEISSVLHLRPSRVSGSTKKATVVARSLVMRPRVLVLDDPTTGLSGARVARLINMIHEGRTRGAIDFVFFVSEDMSFSRKVATRTLEIKDQGLHQTELVQGGFIFRESKKGVK